MSYETRIYVGADNETGNVDIQTVVKWMGD